MQHVEFRVQNRFLMSLGWQRCVADALKSKGFTAAEIPPSARIAHRPVPNQQHTLFMVYWKDAGEEGGYIDPAKGTVQELGEFMYPLQLKQHHEIAMNMDSLAQAQQLMNTKEIQTKGRMMYDPAADSVVKLDGE